MRRWMPAIMTVVGVAAFGWLAVRRALMMPSMELRVATAVFLVGYLAWMAWESRVSVDEISKFELDADRWTLELAVAVKLVLVAAVVAGPYPQLPRPAALALVGLAFVLLTCGAALRIAAIRALGRGYSHRIRHPVLPLVETGPYAWIRHPAYVGTCLIHAGMVCVVPNIYALGALAGWLAVTAIRAWVEDRWLQRLEPYQRYRDVVRGAWLPRSRRM